MSLSVNHSFIIKLWLEDAGEAEGQVTWRGHITHVPSGTRQYLKNLADIIAFIAQYLSVAEKTASRRPWWQRRLAKRYF